MAKTKSLEIIPADGQEIASLNARNDMTAHRELTPAIWKMISEIAPSMYKSRLFGMTTPDAAAAIMLKGYELGLSITASFEFVQVIQGKPTLSPRGAMALLLSHPLVENIEIKRIEQSGVFSGYQCAMKRKGGFEHTAQFTLEDAQRAGLFKPDSGWSKYPENMCLWRAIGFAADVVFPDVTAGMTTLMKAPEMYGVALTEGGDVILEQVSSAPNTAQDLNALLINLVNTHGAEKIMEAAGGTIPQTDAEIEAVRIKLAE